MGEEIISINSGSEAFADSPPCDPIIIHDKFSVTLKQSDYDRLNPELYLNDNLIDFFLNLYIHNRNEFHAFNSFFYRTLTEQGFSKVQNWTRSVNIFLKKYWIIPIAQMEHWVMVIITNPSHAFTNADPPSSMLFFDSLDLKVFDPQAALENYMRNEWVARGNPDKEISVPLYLLSLPLQDNQWDCGVFLIYYSERFIARPEFFMDPYKDYSEIFDADDMEMKRERLKNIIEQVKDEVPYKEIRPESVVIKIPIDGINFDIGDENDDFMQVDQNYGLKVQGELEIEKNKKSVVIRF